MDTTLDGRFMPPPTPVVLNSPVQENNGASNTSHLWFERFGEENAENPVTHSGKGLEVFFSDDTGGPTLADRMSSSGHVHVMLPPQTQYDSDSGDIFYEEDWVTIVRRADDSHPTLSTVIMSTDLPYVLTI